MKITRRKGRFTDKMFYFVEHEGRFLCCTGQWCDTFDAHDHSVMGLPVTRYGLGCTTKQKLMERLKEKHEEIFYSLC